MTIRIDYTAIQPMHHLQLERENERFWIVTDRWNPDTVMLRSADQDLCVRFMRAFAEREPGATADLFSWRVAQAGNVHYLFHEQTDEAS